MCFEVLKPITEAISKEISSCCQVHIDTYTTELSQQEISQRQVVRRDQQATAQDWQPRKAVEVPRAHSRLHPEARYPPALREDKEHYDHANLWAMVELLRGA